MSELSGEQREAIGSVAFEWSHLENRVHSLFLQVAQPSHGIGIQLLKTIRSLEALFDIVIKSGEVPGELLGDLRRLKGEVSNLAGERGRAVHIAWWQSLSDPEIMRREPSESSEPVAAEDLRDLAARINGTAEKVGNLMFEMRRSQPID